MDDNQFTDYVQPTVVTGQDPYQEPLKLGDWIVTLLLQMIPCVGTIMLFVWAFGKGDISRKRYAQATLIFALVVFVLYLIILIVAGASILRFIQNFELPS